MVINNENKRNISMYKQAADIAVNPNDANNPLPAALMLGAIGGIAGLGGSLLSKKQRKHKLRNTLLGATALPAAFLAANKWGPEAVKGKLNDFSGNVYNQYDKHIANKIPADLHYLIGDRNIENSSRVSNAKELKTKREKELTAFNQTQPKTIKPKDRPVYDNGTRLSEASKNKQLDEAKKTQDKNIENLKNQYKTDRASKQKEIDTAAQEAQTQFANKLKENENESSKLNTTLADLQAKMLAADTANKDARDLASIQYEQNAALVVDPRSTKEWGARQNEITNLKNKRNAAVIDMLQEQLNADGENRLPPGLRDAVMRINAKNTVTDQARRMAETDLAAAQTNEKTLADNWRKLNKTNEGLKKEVAKTEEAYKKLQKYDVNSEFKDQINALKALDDKIKASKGDPIEFVKAYTGELSSDDKYNLLDSARQIAEQQGQLASIDKYKSDIEEAVEAKRKALEANWVKNLPTRLETYYRTHGDADPDAPLPESEALTEELAKAKVEALLKPEREKIEQEFRNKVDTENKEITAAIVANKDKLFGNIQRLMVEQAAKRPQMDANLKKDIAARRESLGKEIGDAYRDWITARAKLQNHAKSLEDARIAWKTENDKIAPLQKKFDDSSKSYLDAFYNTKNPELKAYLETLGKQYDTDKIAPLERTNAEQIAKYTGDQESLVKQRDSSLASADEIYGNTITPLQVQIVEVSNKIDRLKAVREKLIESNIADSGAASTVGSQALMALETTLNNQIAKEEKNYSELENKLNEQYEQDFAQFKAEQEAYDKYLQDIINQNAASAAQWETEKANREGNLESAEKGIGTARERERDLRRRNQNAALAATGGGAGALILLSALDKLRKRRKQKISPEEYLNYLEEEGMA